MEIICKIYLNNYLSRFSSLLPGGLKILILNGPDLQIQTNGTAPNIRWVGTSTRSVTTPGRAPPTERHEHPLGRVANPDQRRGVEHPRGRVEHPPSRANGTQPNIRWVGRVSHPLGRIV